MSNGEHKNGLTFVKFGGSAITNKQGTEEPEREVIRRLANEVAEALTLCPTLSLLIGHGSGSFGHHYASQYGIHRGLGESEPWMGFALTANAVLRLNRLVTDALLEAGVPVLPLQPCAALRSAGGYIVSWDTTTLSHALARRMVPVIHGDVVFDTIQGCAIVSTEMLFAYLAKQPSFRPKRIILVGESAVYTANPHRDPQARPIPRITSENIGAVLQQVDASHATDVTGGMRSKIETMWRLVEDIPDLSVLIVGTAAGSLRQALLGDCSGVGTVICHAPQ